MRPLTSLPEHGDNGESALNFSEEGAHRSNGQAPSLLSFRYDRYSLGSRVAGFVKDNRGDILSDRSIVVDGQDVEQVPLSFGNRGGSAGRESIKIFLVTG